MEAWGRGGLGAAKEQGVDPGCFWSQGDRARGGCVPNATSDDPDTSSHHLRDQPGRLLPYSTHVLPQHPLTLP